MLYFRHERTPMGLSKVAGAPSRPKSITLNLYNPLLGSVQVSRKKFTPRINSRFRRNIAQHRLGLTHQLVLKVRITDPLPVQENS